MSLILSPPPFFFFLRLPHQSTGPECYSQAIQQRGQGLLRWLCGLLCETPSSHRYEKTDKVWHVQWSAIANADMAFHFTCIPLLFAVVCCNVLLCSILTSESRSSKKLVLLKSWPWSYSACYRQLQAERCHAAGICHLPIWWCKYFLCPVFQFSSARICSDHLVAVFVVFQTTCVTHAGKKRFLQSYSILFYLFIFLS